MYFQKSLKKKNQVNIFNTCHKLNYYVINKIQFKIIFRKLVSIEKYF